MGNGNHLPISQTTQQPHTLPTQHGHQLGKVLTAHRSGAEFTKECGLGQGSVLAPLKWKLFLDPLLKKLRTIEAPYTIGTGVNTVDI